MRKGHLDGGACGQDVVFLCRPEDAAPEMHSIETPLEE